MFVHALPTTLNPYAINYNNVIRLSKPDATLVRSTAFIDSGRKCFMLCVDCRWENRLKHVVDTQSSSDRNVTTTWKIPRPTRESNPSAGGERPARQPIDHVDRLQLVRITHEGVDSYTVVCHKQKNFTNENSFTHNIAR